MRVFLWQEANGQCLFQRLSASEGLQVGGGGEGCAIQLYPGLLHGISRRSATYENEILGGSASGDFEIQDVEIWALSWRPIDFEAGLLSEPRGSFFIADREA